VKLVALRSLLCAVALLGAAEPAFAQQSASSSTEPAYNLGGQVVDDTGGAVTGAEVTARKGDVIRRTTTAADGSFVLTNVAGGDWVVEVAARGFSRLARTVKADGDGGKPLTFTLALAPIEASVAVEAQGTTSYTIADMNTATGLNLSARDTPQSVSVVTRERIEDQEMVTVAEALRSTTGISVKPVDRGRNMASGRQTATSESRPAIPRFTTVSRSSGALPVC